MRLLPGIGVLALAVLLGGLAALVRGRAMRFMPAVRTFAVVAAASVALLHLLPEAMASHGWRAHVATALGLVGPSLLERVFPVHGGHEHRAPTTALSIGYAAVLVHQLGEGAALATLARSGALSPSVVLAVAAHTVPLAMVVAIGVLEAKGGRGLAAPSVATTAATALALIGVALATAAGALVGSVVSQASLSVVEPWALATIAGLLLHALAHDALPAPTTTPRGRVLEAVAGILGLATAVAGIEEHGWIQAFSASVRGVGLGLVATLVVGRSFVSRGIHDHDRHDHGEHG